jgi:hypothetical protein
MHYDETQKTCFWPSFGYNWLQLGYNHYEPDHNRLKWSKFAFGFCAGYKWLQSGYKKALFPLEIETVTNA